MGFGRRALVAAVALTAAVSACTPGRTDQHPARTSAPAVVAPPTTHTTCPVRQAEDLLHAFVEDFNTGKADLVPAYFAAPERFVRWWDPTRGPGMTVEYPGLGSHLRTLYNQGIRLVITDFSGSPNNQDGVAFIFGVRRVATKEAAPGPITGKGVLDCATGRFTVVVIDWWGS